jgi:hypothetical protein
LTSSSSTSSPPFLLARLSEVIHAQFKRQCCRRISTIIGREKMKMTSTSPIKLPFGPPWNPRSPLTSHNLPVFSISHDHLQARQSSFFMPSMDATWGPAVQS